MIASLTNTQGIVAIGAAAVAVVALLGCAYLAFSVRRLRRAQGAVLGEFGERDLAAHALELQEAFVALRHYVEETTERFDARVAAAETALQGAIAHRALVRYDAYNEQSGQQSFSIAVLDETRSGVVLSCINHRDQARLYAKQVHQGEGELTLSPEEAEAVQIALSRSVLDAAVASPAAGVDGASSPPA
jgi:tRNA-binding EMAP/Myf-like protein